MFLGGFEVADVRSKCGEAHFLIVQLACVALGQGLLLGSAFEGLHVFAQSFLILEDVVDVRLLRPEVGIQLGDGILLRNDLPEGTLNLRRQFTLGAERLDLIQSQIRQRVLRYDGALSSTVNVLVCFDGTSIRKR